MKKYKLAIAISLVVIISFFWARSTAFFLLKSARSYEQNGRPDKAMEIYEKILRKSEIKTKNPLTLIFNQKLSPEDRYNLAKKLAIYYLNHGKKLKAVGCYKILQEINPRKLDEYLNLYALTRDTPTLVDIILDSKDSRLKDKILPEYLKTPLWRYYYGMGLVKRKRWQGARIMFSSLASQYPYLSTFHYCLGYIFQELNSNEKAKKEYKIAYELNPDYLPLKENPKVKEFNPSFDFRGIWDLDEGKGTVVKDGSGNCNYGLIRGEAKWMKGIIRNAIKFDGKYGLVIIPDDPATHLDYQHSTITLWIKPVPQKKNRFVYYKRLIHLRLDRSDKDWFFMLSEPRGDRDLTISCPVTDKWYFVVQRITQNREHKVWLFDKDGIIKSFERSDVGATTNSNGKNFILGQADYSLEENDYANFQGVIDEVKIFSRSLTDVEIEKLFEYYKSKM